jgi:hypothetical protein
MWSDQIDCTLLNYGLAADRLHVQETVTIARQSACVVDRCGNLAGPLWCVAVPIRCRFCTLCVVLIVLLRGLCAGASDLPVLFVVLGLGSILSWSLGRYLCIPVIRICATVNALMLNRGDECPCR